jgi:microcystin-dependent protein
VSRTTYANLFVALGSGAYYGTGDGSSTFNLPDLRQAFPMGKAASGTGAVLGSKGGFKDASIVTHTHAVSDPGHNHTQNQHNHTQDQHKHTLTGGRHAHAIDGDYGFRIAVTTGEPAGNHIPGAGAGQGVSWSDIDQADILNPLDDTGGVSALDMNNFTATNQPFTATNIAGGTNLTVGNPNQTNVAATDRNLPPWQAVNYLVKT